MICRQVHIVKQELGIQRWKKNLVPEIWEFIVLWLKSTTLKPTVGCKLGPNGLTLIATAISFSAMTWLFESQYTKLILCQRGHLLLHFASRKIEAKKFYNLLQDQIEAKSRLESCPWLPLGCSFLLSRNSA